MRKIIILLLTVLVTPGLTALLAAAQPASRPWTLQDCIRHALDNNITVQQSALQVKQREIDLNTARSSRLPGVSAGASQNFSFGRGLTEDNTYTHANTASTSFSLGADLTLFHGLRAQHNVALGELNLQAATQDLEKARDDIRVAVAQSYVQILYRR
ncbi:MAG: TolC family protein, partial [Bacteroidales bacterium]|nr:TolC family protein [Bacteroidales bacterium]